MLNMFRALPSPSSGARDYMCVLLPPMVCSACLLVVGGQVQGSRLCVQAEGFCTSCSIPRAATYWYKYMCFEANSFQSKHNIISQENVISIYCKYLTYVYMLMKFFRSEENGWILRY